MHQRATLFGCPQRLWISVVFVVSLSYSSGVRSCVPYFLTEPERVVVAFGANVTLFCDARPSDVTLTWTHNGVALGGRHSVLHRTRKALHVRLKASSVEGVYQCYASNSCGTIVSRAATVSRAVLLPHVEQLVDREIVTVRGNVAMIPCARANSIPLASVQFEFNGRTLKLASRHAVLPSGNLQIRDASSSDDGSYRCVFVNPITNEKLPSPNTVHLKVNESVANAAPRFTWTPLTNVEVISGQTLTLECVAEGWPVPVVQWLKYGGQLPTGRHSQLLGNLIIESVREGDEGTYICRAENVAGQPQANVVFVEILEPPRIILAPSSQNVSWDTVVTMHCHVTGRPMPLIKWFHNGILLSQSQDVAITNESLLLLNIQSDAAGIYQCMAVNTLGTAHSYALLSLHGNRKPPSAAARKQNSDDDDYYPAADTRVSLSPERSSKSRHDRPPLRKVTSTEHDFSNSRQKLSYMDGQEEELEVEEEEYRSPWKSTAPDDLQGQGQGRDGRRKAAKETVGVKLVPPSKPNVTKISDTSVMLHWTVPPNDGLRITFFKIQYKEITDNQRKTGWRTVDKDISPILYSFKVDTGLKAGNTYQFRMVAVYSNFDNKHGPNSVRVTLGSLFRPRVPQNSPIIVRVWSTSSSTLSIEWQYVLSERVAIDGFYIYYKRYDTEMDYIRQTILGPDVRVTLLTGLDADSHYSIRMQCFNAFGQSEFSNTATKFTLAGSMKLKTSSAAYDILENGWLYEDHDIKDFVGSVDGLHELSRVSPAANIDDLSTSNVYHVETRQRMLNNETLYIILGTVIGTMLIVFVMSLAACMWKQCQQRRILALLENGGSYVGGSRVADVDNYCNQHPFLFVASSKKPDKQSSLCQPCNKMISRHTSSSYVERTIDDIRSSLSAITQTENMIERNEDGEEESSSAEDQCFSNQSLHLLQLNVKKLQQFSVPERHSVAVDTVYATGEIRVEATSPLFPNGSHFCNVDSKSAEDLRFPQIVKQHHHHRHQHHHHHPGRQGLADCHRHHRHRHHHHHNQRHHLEQQQRVTSLT